MKIENGLSKIKEAHKRSESADKISAKQWRNTKNKIDSLLKSGNKPTDELKTVCVMLEAMNHEDRCKKIIEYWGIQYLNKVMPLLQQLSSLESVG
jgi:hypothetical protein